MYYGTCNLSIVPLRKEPSDTSELVSQLLYGELFKILELRKNWMRVRLYDDGYEGWMDTKQYIEISEIQYSSFAADQPIMATDLISYVSGSNELDLISIPMGSRLNALEFFGHTHEGHHTNGTLNKSMLIDTAINYLNSPYLWGGKTPFGIDCSGFTQMVYKLNGHKILRDASMQANQGEPLSFIEESEPGDLAFFDNQDGDIIHVGIIMKDHHIIHAHGKVRIDRLDHTGIYNSEKRCHTHKLRVIKKII